jgi:integrase
MFRQQSVPQLREELKRSKQEFWRFAGAGFVGRCRAGFGGRTTEYAMGGYGTLDIEPGEFRSFQVKATPHTFRHQAITWLTRHSGMADAELQLITGHAKRETLAIYQHVALDGQLEDRYQKAMRDAEL